jgi:hypothetical protein
MNIDSIFTAPSHKSAHPDNNSWETCEENNLFTPAAGSLNGQLHGITLAARANHGEPVAAPG